MFNQFFKEKIDIEKESYLIGENLNHFEEIWREIDSNCLK
jgi:hypothetical protein